MMNVNINKNAKGYGFIELLMGIAVTGIITGMALNYHGKLKSNNCFENVKLDLTALTITLENESIYKLQYPTNDEPLDITKGYPLNKPIWKPDTLSISNFDIYLESTPSTYKITAQGKDNFKDCTISLDEKNEMIIADECKGKL